MTISELIERLEALKAEHGDLLVWTMTQQEDWVAVDPFVRDVDVYDSANRRFINGHGVVI